MATTDYLKWAQAQSNNPQVSPFIPMANYGPQQSPGLLGSGPMPLGSGQYGMESFNNSLAELSPNPMANLTIPQNGAPGGFVDTNGGGGFLSSMMGTTQTPGWGGMALGGLTSAANLFMGMKQFGLAKDTLAENKRQFGLNYGAQKSQTNGMMEDRQRARVASNAGAYQSVGDYMNKNGIA